MRVVRTPRPAGVNERVVKSLLNIVDDLVLEVIGAIGEEKNPRRSFLDDRLMTRSDRTRQVACEKADDPRLVGRRDAACLLSAVPILVTRLAIGDALPDHQVATAKHLTAEKAEGPRRSHEVVELQRFRAFRTHRRANKMSVHG
jgi:hypothetical protein